MTASGSPTTPPAKIAAQVPRAVRAWRWWLGLVGAAFLIGTAWALYGYFTQGEDHVAPLSTRADGSGALTEVLRDEGTDVRVISDVTDTDVAPGRGDLVVFGTGEPISEKRIRELYESEADVVFLDLGSSAEALDLPVIYAPSLDFGVVAAACNAWPARLAPTADIYAPGLLAFADSSGRARTPENGVLCYSHAGDDDDDLAVGALALWEDNGRSVAVLADPQILQNQWILDESHAALALGLFGNHDTVYWYHLEHVDPQYLDEERESPQLFGMNIVALLWAVFFFLLALFLWRGRRLGPIVRENLPVTVAATESVFSLASLYRDNKSWNWAATVIRSNELTAMSRSLGIASVRDTDAVLALVAEHSSYTLGELQAQWREPVASASDLKRTADWWLELRRHVERNLNNDPTTQPAKSVAELSDSTKDEGNA